MVKSGLVETEEQKKARQEIRVSPYRLATHLGMALATFSLLLWNGLEQLRGTPHGRPTPGLGLTNLQSTQSSATLAFSPDTISGLRKLRHGAKGLLYIAGLTAMSGGLGIGGGGGGGGVMVALHPLVMLWW